MNREEMLMSAKTFISENEEWEQSFKFEDFGHTPPLVLAMDQARNVLELLDRIAKLEKVVAAVRNMRNGSMQDRGFYHGRLIQALSELNGDKEE